MLITERLVLQHLRDAWCGQTAITPRAQYTERRSEDATRCFYRRLPGNLSRSLRPT